MSKILWLASYPKSGNTWLRAFLANYLSNPAQPVPINELYRHVSGDMDSWPYEKILGGPVAERPVEDIYAMRDKAHRLLAGQSQGIVLVKTHNRLGSFDSLPTITPEVTFGAIYVIRNPLDVIVSYAHHYGLGIDDSIEATASDVHFVPAKPGYIHQDIGSWSGHALSWTRAPGLYRYVMRYEDCQARPTATFGGILDFLKAPRDRGRLKKALKFSSFKVLSTQERKDGFSEKSANAERFFRHGKSGSWQRAMTPEQVERVVGLHGEVMREFGYLDETGRVVA